MGAAERGCAGLVGDRLAVQAQTRGVGCDGAGDDLFCAIDEGGADGLRQGDVSVLVKAARVDPGRVGGWRRGVDGHGVGGAGADGEVGVSQGVAGHVG